MRLRGIDLDTGPCFWPDRVQQISTQPTHEDPSPDTARVKGALFAAEVPARAPGTYPPVCPSSQCTTSQLVVYRSWTLEESSKVRVPINPRCASVVKRGIPRPRACGLIIRCSSSTQ